MITSAHLPSPQKDPQIQHKPKPRRPCLEAVAMMRFQCEHENEDSVHTEVPVGWQNCHLIPVKLDCLPSVGELVEESTDH